VLKDDSSPQRKTLQWSMFIHTNCSKSNTFNDHFPLECGCSWAAVDNLKAARIGGELRIKIGLIQLIQLKLLNILIASRLKTRSRQKEYSIHNEYEAPEGY